jgi:dipeptidyl aminopeptidase/acylaminoacyl peptidase
VINVDGSGLQRLTTSTGYANDEPAWSPDGRRIAFVSGRPGKPVGAYTMAADGSDVRYVAPTSVGNAYPAWSPDGSTLALTFANALWVVPSAGGTPKKLTQAVASIQSPSWSPDGKQIAVNWAITKTDWEIFAIPVGNPGAAKNISDDVGAKVKGDDRYPDWAPAMTSPDIEADGICKPKDLTVSGVGAKVRLTWTGTRPTRVKFGLHALDADLGTRKAPYSATVVLQAAGLAKYDCGLVQDSYIVRVPPIASPSDPQTIIWATSKARASWVYDVQYRKAGDAKWTNWLRESPVRSKRFVVAGGGAGTYEFRARMFQFDRGADNTVGFSPPLTVELK